MTEINITSKAEFLALRLKTYGPSCTLNAWEVNYLVSHLGKSFSYVMDFQLTEGGRRELAKLIIFRIGRDIAIAYPAIIVIIGSIIKHFIK